MDERFWEDICLRLVHHTTVIAVLVEIDVHGHQDLALVRRPVVRVAVHLLLVLVEVGGDDLSLRKTSQPSLVQRRAIQRRPEGSSPPPAQTLRLHLLLAFEQAQEAGPLFFVAPQLRRLRDFLPSGFHLTHPNPTATTTTCTRVNDHDA